MVGADLNSELEKLHAKRSNLFVPKVRPIEPNPRTKTS